jgi:hypothetical protein
MCLGLSFRFGVAWVYNSYLFVTLQGLLRIHFSAFRYQLHIFSLTIHSDFVYDSLYHNILGGLYVILFRLSS